MWTVRRHVFLESSSGTEQYCRYILQSFSVQEVGESLLQCVSLCDIVDSSSPFALSWRPFWVRVQQVLNS